MKLEQQVVSLELAIELKEAGWKQESLHWWGGIGNMGIWCDHVKDGMPEQETRFTWISAPTVAELGEALPIKIEKNLDNYVLHCWKHSGWSLNFFFFLNEKVSAFLEHSIMAKTEADARAKMWLYLKKEGLLK